MTSGKTLVYMTTIPATIENLMHGHLGFFRELGYRVVVISSPGPSLDRVRDRDAVEVEEVAMCREISPLRDLVSLFRLFLVLWRLKPDIVNAGTPKAGLLGMLAAWMSRVPSRCYTLRGLRLETTVGWKRSLLTLTEKIAGGLATCIPCNSRSLRARYLELFPGFSAKCVVLGEGSSNGVDGRRFFPRGEKETQALREQLGLKHAQTVGFVGRLTVDKGVGDLISVMKQVRGRVGEVNLLLVGPFEDGDPLGPSVRNALLEDSATCHTGMVSDVAPYYPLMDVLAFASRREGFPNSILEAASTGVPTVGYRVTGVSDAIVDGVTGFLIEEGDVSGFGAAVCRLLQEESLRAEFSVAGERRAREDFAPEGIWKALHEVYSKA
jgi:glycosyltransferase involved in cell wall biosynthesis